MLTAKISDKSDWFGEDLIRDIHNQKSASPSHFIQSATLFLQKFIKIPYYYYRDIEIAIETKCNANKFLVKEIISRLQNEITVNKVIVNKIAVDYVSPNIYFWLETKDNDYESIKKIELILENLNTEFNRTEFKIKHFLTEESLDLGVPDDFFLLKD